MTSDSLVKCTACGREERPNFGVSLRSGWPMCCGYTMRLLRTEADIEATTKQAVALPVPPEADRG